MYLNMQIGNNKKDRRAIYTRKMVPALRDSICHHVFNTKM